MACWTNPVRRLTVPLMLAASCAAIAACAKGDKTCLIAVTLAPASEPIATDEIVFTLTAAAGAITRTHATPETIGQVRFELADLPASHAGEVTIRAEARKQGCLVGSGSVRGQLVAGSATEAAEWLRLAKGPGCGAAPDAGVDASALVDAAAPADMAVAPEVAGPVLPSWTHLIPGFTTEQHGTPRLAPASADQTYVAWTGNEDQKWKVSVASVTRGSPDVTYPPNLQAGAMPQGPVSLIRDDGGRLYLAWIEDGKIVVKRLDGNQWTALGQPISVASEPTAAACPALLFDRNMRLVVAWTQGMPRFIHLRSWTGTAWEPMLRGPLFAEATAGLEAQVCPALASRGPVALAAAWVESKNVHVHRWDGTAWSPWSDKLLPATPADSLTLAGLILDPEGNPTVAWQETKGTNSTLSVRRMRDTKWLPPTALPFPTIDRAGVLGPSALTTDPGGDGTAWLAWYEDVAGQLTVQAWKRTGETWERAGASFRGQGSATEVSLAVHSGAAFAAFVDVRTGVRALYVSHFK